MAKSKIDEDELIRNGGLGDISDFYTIILNPEIKHEDFNDCSFYYAIRNKFDEVHFCKIWINWFLPVYYIETSYEKTIDNGEYYEDGPLNQLSLLEKNTIEKLTSILNEFGYSPLQLDFLKQTIPEVSEKSVVGYDYSIFDCLFSDMMYYTEDIVKLKNEYK